jgi:hypothetical protein
MFAASKTAAVSGAGPDAQFNYVTMLLHGDGTNGAQNNTFLDSSTNNFTITRNGNTTQGSFSPYGSNWSNYFDGSGDYLTTSSSQIIPTGSFTVECFAFVTGSGNNQKFVAQGTSGTAGRFSLGIEGGNWWVQIGSDAIQTGTPVRNQWNYVAVTYNGSTITLYVNGTSIGTVSSSANAQNTTLTIGQDWNSYITTGYISNVRVSNTVRTVTTTPTAPFTSDGNTRLLACQANRFLDSSANAFALTVNGNPSVQRFNPFGTSTAYSTSVIGGSGYFDGSGDYLVSPASSSYQFAGDFTIEYWANFSAIDGVMPIGQTYTGNNFQIYYSADGSIEFGGLNLGLVSTSAGVIVKNSWHHGALVRSGSTVTLYINGVSRGTITSSSTVGNNADIGIGARPNNAYNCTGYISNVRLVSSAVYTTTFTPPTTPFTAISGTVLLLSTTNAAIFDNAMMNDLETVGNAQISTSVKKYGTGSLAFDGTGDYLASNSAGTNVSYAFGTGNFTIELWLYLNTVSGGPYFIYDGRPLTTQGAYPCLFMDNATLTYQVNSGDLFYATLATGTWYHIAVCRSGTTNKLFVNGTQQGSATDSTNYLSGGAGRPGIGGGGYATNAYFLNGYIDDLRITKGFARYTANFTPPTAAFSDTGPY